MLLLICWGFVLFSERKVIPQSGMYKIIRNVTTCAKRISVLTLLCDDKTWEGCPVYTVSLGLVQITTLVLLEPITQGYQQQQ